MVGGTIKKGFKNTQFKHPLESIYCCTCVFYMIINIIISCHGCFVIYVVMLILQYWKVLLYRFIFNISDWVKGYFVQISVFSHSHNALRKKKCKK